MLNVVRPGPDYTLRWPRELFAQEAQVLLDAQPLVLEASWRGQVEWLLTEAFAASAPVVDFRQSDTQSTWNNKTSALAKIAPYLRQPALFLQALIDAAPRLPELSAPKPYWPARQGRQLSAADQHAIDPSAPRRDWLTMVNSLKSRGYLAHVAPEICVDDNVGGPEPAQVLDDAIAERLGVAGLWMAGQPESWDDDTFYGLVEVIHDLVQRPRSRSYHDYGNCGYHYDDFTYYPAQVLYRWSANRILTRYKIDLVLAKSGEDVGRLIHQPTDGRAALVEAVLAVKDTAALPTLEHAISLFRGRAATREDKRSACVALAGLLEESRVLLKERLHKKDEGALFQIANEFAVRHRNARQHDDYDEAYLDWLFWWYLATFDLTIKLLSRDQPGTR